MPEPNAPPLDRYNSWSTRVPLHLRSLAAADNKSATSHKSFGSSLSSKPTCTFEHSSTSPSEKAAAAAEEIVALTRHILHLVNTQAFSDPWWKAHMSTDFRAHILNHGESIDGRDTQLELWRRAGLAYPDARDEIDNLNVQLSDDGGRALAWMLISTSSQPVSYLGEGVSVCTWQRDEEGGPWMFVKRETLRGVQLFA